MKSIILLFVTIFGGLGSYIPFLFGDQNLVDGWGILGGLIGGFVGIWLGVAVSKRWG
ncbi:MAG: hypothetical protein ABJA64_01135 [Candidatus Saccharibacteria bacterium]